MPGGAVGTRIRALVDQGRGRDGRRFPSVFSLEVSMKCGGGCLADAHFFPRMISTHLSSSLGTLWIHGTWKLRLILLLLRYQSSEFLVNFVFTAVGLVFLPI